LMDRMTIRRLVLREIGYRKLSFALAVLSVVVAVGCLVGALTLLKAHDARTGQILQAKQAQIDKQMAKLNDDMRKAMLKLGFNLMIFPKDQRLGDWYADDYGRKYMPEQYVSRLAGSGIITVRHLLPSLVQKIKWPEKKRTVILVGTRGEVPNLQKAPRKPLVQPVPPNTMVLGHELHESLGLNVGDKVTFMGTEFTVHKCNEERGSKDDITVWIHLAQAQELLDKPGRINAILALGCLCTGAKLSAIRRDISRVLPDTKVVEVASRVIVRAEARTKAAATAKQVIDQEKASRARLRAAGEAFAAVLVPVVLAGSVLWVAFLSFNNVRERRSEIGILRALGVQSRRSARSGRTARPRSASFSTRWCWLWYWSPRRCSVALPRGSPR